jgi:hypothetical protein
MTEPRSAGGGGGLLDRLLGRARGRPDRPRPDDVDPHHVHAFVDPYDGIPLGGLLKGEMMVADQRNGRSGSCKVCGRQEIDAIHATAADD